MSFDMVRKKTISVQGKEKEVQIYVLKASDGFLLGTKILKLSLPVLGGAADAAFTEDTDLPSTFSEISMRLSSQLDNVDVLSMVKQLIDGLTIDRKEVNFDEYFMANYGELLLILNFALTENFRSFFEVVGLKTLISKTLKVITGVQAESDEL